MHTNEHRRINDYRGTDRIYTVDDLRPFKGIFWNAVIVAVLAMLIGALLYLGTREMNRDAYAANNYVRGDYSQPTCWVIPGDYPDPNMRCPE